MVVYRPRWERAAALSVTGRGDLALQGSSVEWRSRLKAHLPASRAKLAREVFKGSMWGRVAAIIRSELSDPARAAATLPNIASRARRFADVFKADNVVFSYDWFFGACGLKRPDNCAATGWGQPKVGAARRSSEVTTARWGDRRRRGHLVGVGIGVHVHGAVFTRRSRQRDHPGTGVLNDPTRGGHAHVCIRLRRPRRHARTCARSPAIGQIHWNAEQFGNSDA